MLTRRLFKAGFVQSLVQTPPSAEDVAAADRPAPASQDKHEPTDKSQPAAAEKQQAADQAEVKASTFLVARTLTRSRVWACARHVPAIW